MTLNEPRRQIRKTEITAVGKTHKARLYSDLFQALTEESFDSSRH